MQVCVLLLIAMPGIPAGKSAYSVGQQWTYLINGKEAVAPLEIVGAGIHPRAGAGLDIRLNSLPLSDGSTMMVTVRISEVALKKSTVRMVRDDPGQKPIAGFPEWNAASWIFETSVDDALKSLRIGLEASLNTNCEFDREKMLALDQDAFDQDMNGGWRKLGNVPQCQAVAADLIRDYRVHHKNEASILYWHEGQMRASIGQKVEAIALFEKSRHVPDNGTGWNQYVDATVAFLRGDRKAFDAARNELVALPKPADWDTKTPDGTPVPWPMNLGVVDGLGKCFDRPYSEAYGVCR
jgi:hypothetical protein